jgi:GT2 family glycosyltransferase
MARVAVHLVTWNGEKYIPWLFQSLRAQTYSDIIFRVLDNGSTDATVELIERELKNFPWPHQVIKNPVNEGFAGGHNVLFKNTQEEFVLLVNQDMYLESDCIERLVTTLESNARVSVVAPRLMKWNFEDIAREGLVKSFSDQIDSLGLSVFRNRRVVEWRAGEVWNSDVIKKNVEVFGVSGALPLYRMEALQMVVDKEGNIFDPWFGSYKEDVDLAWRLQKAGWSALVATDAVAYHHRAAAMPKFGLHDVAALLNKFQQPVYVRYLSYRNHLLMLFKNEEVADFWHDAPWIVWYEVKKFIALLVSYPSVLFKSWWFIWQHRHELDVRRHQAGDKKLVWSGWFEQN